LLVVAATDSQAIAVPGCCRGLQARDTVKYEQNKPKLMGHIADCETKLEEAKAAVVTAKEELGAQRLQLRSDKERAVKQMLFSLNQAYVGGA